MVEIKKGWHTSEFILSVGTSVAALAVALGVADAAPVVREIAIAIAGVVPVAYALLRTFLKSVIAKTALADWFVEDGDTGDAA
jgi:hypothetical protein